MNDTRNYVNERYDIITMPNDREAMEKYGFWLSPYETIKHNGVKHYRVIFPGSKKGGWSPDYMTPIEMQIPDDAHINTLDKSKENPANI